MSEKPGARVPMRTPGAFLPDRRLVRDGSIKRLALALAVARAAIAGRPQRVAAER